MQAACRLTDESITERDDGQNELDLKSLAKQLSRFSRPNALRSLFELTLTLGLFLCGWVSIVVLLDAGWSLALLLAVPTGGMLLRLFIIQHDCGHGAFLASRRGNNRLGALLGVLTLTPYAVWRDAHARHHATAGNLARRGVGDVDTLTVAEYVALSRTRRVAYRLYRHPLTLFGLGPAYLFLVRNRLPIGQMRDGWRPWASAMGTNAAVLGLFGALTLVWGMGSIVLTHVAVVLVAASCGVWLFFVQHQFEDAHWSDGSQWDFHRAAIHGSSYYALPKALHWVSGNIGFHHIHHLVSRIPFYRLPEAMDAQPILNGVGHVTLRQSLRNVTLALWDEDSVRLVSFRTARARLEAGELDGTPDHPHGVARTYA